MDTLTLKIPDSIREILAMYAKDKGISKSEVVRNALVEYFRKDASRNQGTFYDLSRDLAGSVNAALDLSTNKDHLSGFGK